jgi:hypothetical protein
MRVRNPKKAVEQFQLSMIGPFYPGVDIKTCKSIDVGRRGQK